MLSLERDKAKAIHISNSLFHKYVTYVIKLIYLLQTLQTHWYFPLIAFTALEKNLNFLESN